MVSLRGTARANDTAVITLSAALREGSLALSWGIAHSFSAAAGTDRACPTPDHDMTWTKVANGVDFVESALGFQCLDFTGDNQTYARCW